MSKKLGASNLVGLWGIHRNIEKKVLPWDSITAPDFITNFDHTMACVVTWLEGHSLAQTVFTNLVRWFTCLLFRSVPGYFSIPNCLFHVHRGTLFWNYNLGSWLFIDDTIWEKLYKLERKCYNLTNYQNDFFSSWMFFVCFCKPCFVEKVIKTYS